MSSISLALAGTTSCFQQPNGQWHCINGQLLGIGRTKTIAMHNLNNQLHPIHHPHHTVVTHPVHHTHHHLVRHHHHNKVTTTHPNNFVTTKQNTVIKSNGPIKNKGNNFLVTKNINGKTIVETNHPENLHIKSNHPVTIIKKGPPPPDTSDPLGGVIKGITDAANSTGKFIGDSLGINHPPSNLPTKKHHFHHHSPHDQTKDFTAQPDTTQSRFDRQPVHSGQLGDIAPNTPNKLAVQRALDNQGGITDLGAPDDTKVNPLTPAPKPQTTSVVAPHASSPPSIASVPSTDNESSPPPPSQDISANDSTNTAPPGTPPSDSGNSAVIILGGLVLLGLIVVLI